jgi:large subunit ribosomal protein L23
MRLKKVKVNEFQKYDIVLSPVITEKATMAAQYNQVTFKVARDASKPQIKQAVEQIFGVKVLGVNTLNQQGKTKRFRGRLGYRPAFKKAMVRLAEGQTIDVGTGI